MTDVFDASWRARATVEQVPGARITRLVRHHHYLHSFPAMPALSFALSVDGWVVGACVFAWPPQATAVRYGGKTWELARLWVADHIPRNAETWFVAKCLRWLQVNQRDLMHVVSYADPARGHEGTIYIAGNWERDGMSNPGDVYTVDGHQYGRHKHALKAARRKGAEVKIVPRQQKHRFVWHFKRHQKEATP